MSGGWQGSERKARLPAHWGVLRRAVLKRCEGRCEAMTADGLGRCTGLATEVDHIRAGDDHRMSNLQGLCYWHHKKKSSAEGVEARRLPPARRAPEKHPGAR